MKTSLGLAAILLLCSFGTAAAIAGPLEDKSSGFAAVVQRDYATALRLLRPLAEQGDAEAQGAVGYIYELGCDAPQGQVNADTIMKDLGAIVPTVSSCVKQDYVESLIWYRKSAEKGNAEGERELGSMYYFGHGVEKNYDEAAKWYRKAAEQGDASAQDSLGNMYREGKGVHQDYVQAHKWYNLAAASHNGINELSRTSRDNLARQMTTAQIAEAQRLASEWKVNYVSSSLVQSNYKTKQLPYAEDLFPLSKTDTNKTPPTYAMSGKDILDRLFINMIPFIIAVLGGIVAARAGRNGWKWGVLTFFIIELVIYSVTSPFERNEASPLNAAILLPILVGAMAAYYKRNGWIWGLGSLLVSYVSGFLVVTLFQNFGQTKLLLKGYLSHFTALSMAIGCSVMALYLLRMVRKESLISSMASGAVKKK